MPFCNAYRGCIKQNAKMGSRAYTPRMQYSIAIYHKDIRFLVLYTEYFKNSSVLDTFQLNQFLENMGSYREMLEYVKKDVPIAIGLNAKKSYIRRFFYTQAGFYKGSLDYDSQTFLYNLAHLITRGVNYGES